MGRPFEELINMQITMKKSILFSICLMAGLCWTSCEKEPTTALETAETSEDLALAQNMLQTTEEEVDLLLETRSGDNEDCPTVTFSPDATSFPRTVTIDYGTEGCPGPHGYIRKGLIQIEISDSMSIPGASRTKTFLDFSIDEVSILGTKILTYEGLNDDQQKVWNRSVVDAQLLFPGGEEVSWNAEQTITKIEGQDTDILLDDVFQITGNSSGVNRQGNPFTSSITDPLIKPRNCRWPVSGTREAMVNDLSRSLNYGDGNCDRNATVTWSNGFTRDILLRRWW